MKEKLKIIHDFYQAYQTGLHNLYLKNIKKISKEDFLEDLEDYLSNHLSDINDPEINIKLFYLSNQFSKTCSISVNKQYICPACNFLGKISVLTESKILECQICKNKIKTCKQDKYLRLYRYFSYHYKNGYKCNDCKRFIPDNKVIGNIICPYPDCCFIGTIDSLKKMRHPSLKESIITTVEPQETIPHPNDKVSLINKIIDQQNNQLSFGSTSFTVPHKVCVYRAFKELLHQYPDQMTDYLLNSSRTGGFQHKVFQKYISFLESSFPFLVRKGKKFITINNLLDKNLCLFDGISVFNAVVNNKTLSNNTQEYYIGGRAATISKPYYIGKLLSVINKENRESVSHLVQEYTFNKIKINVPDNTLVEVTHLRVPPHYQMGGMVYVNRVRKSIIDEVKKYE
jgi:hypothetical protein